MDTAAVIKLLAYFVTFYINMMMIIMAMAMAAPTNEKQKCDEFYFYDHGTDHCEHCRDICDDATLKGTIDQCWELCQSYALVLWPPKPLKTASARSDNENSQSGDNPGLPLAAQITILVVCIALIIAAVLAVVRYRAKVLKNRRSRPPPPVEPLDQTAHVLLDNTEENHDSARATNGTDASISTAGIQEEGASGSVQGSPAERTTTTLAEATPSHLTRSNLPVQPHLPIPVSPEGNSGSFAMALPQPYRRTQTLATPNNQVQTEAIVHRQPSLGDDDLDSTELKTLLPSMSDDSLLTGACGGPTLATTTTESSF